MNDFLLQIGKSEPVQKTTDSESKQHLWLGHVSLLDKGAISYIYKNDNLKRSVLVIGNAIPRKKAKQKVDQWLHGKTLVNETEAIEWCKSYNGIFNLIFVDELQYSICIVTDFLGFYPLYMYENQNQICLSNSMKWLAKFCIQNLN
ncbi:MAG: hypothetical protein IPM92_13115 [Saprospiraceae bacterium]|nr:hypothetical protein [Saprospiraceae bacterium]